MLAFSCVRKRLRRLIWPLKQSLHNLVRRLKRQPKPSLQYRRRKWRWTAALKDPNPYQRAQSLWQLMRGAERSPDEEEYISFGDLKRHFPVFKEA